MDRRAWQAAVHGVQRVGRDQHSLSHFSSDPIVFPTNCVQRTLPLPLLPSHSFPLRLQSALYTSRPQEKLPCPPLQLRALPYLASVLARASLLPHPSECKSQLSSSRGHWVDFITHLRIYRSRPRPAPASAPRQPTHTMHRNPHTGIPTHFQMVLQNKYMEMLLLLLSRFSRVRLCATPQTAAHQAPLSLGFSRQEHWSGLPLPSPWMKLKSESEVAQSCPTLSDPMDCSLPGSSVHGIFQARVLEWCAIAFSHFSD